MDCIASRCPRASNTTCCSHTGILTNPEAIREILRIAAEVRAPFPEPQVRELLKRSYRVELGAQYTPLEAFFIHNLGYFTEAMARGALAPVNPFPEHFVRASHGEVVAEGAVETAWIKFIRDYPDRRLFLEKSTGGQTGGR